MKTFERFCEEISSIVECKIISWHGSNYITSIQAYKLLRYGYMLGGFNIRNIGIPLVFVENRNRIHEQTIIRDHKTLEDFYSAYKVLYINPPYWALLQKDLWLHLIQKSKHYCHSYNYYNAP